MEALKRRIEAILVRLRRNEVGDGSQARTLAGHERRIAALERKIDKRAKTLDADE